MKTSVRLLGSVVLTLLVLAACTGKSKESQASIDPDTELVKGLTAKDTADFIGLAQVCMDTLQAGKIDDGLNMIYCIINDTLMPMTDEMRENMKQHFKRFPVKNIGWKILKSMDIRIIQLNIASFSKRIQNLKPALNLRSILFA